MILLLNMFFDLDGPSEMIGSCFQQSETIDVHALISSQFYAYMNDVIVGPEIWEKYPALKEASFYFNTPLTSSAPVERLFSFAGIVNTPRRNALSDLSFEKLVLLKSNGFCQN